MSVPDRGLDQPYRVCVARTPLHLAALAVAAVPGLLPTGARDTTRPGSEYQTAQVMDSRGRMWTVRAPSSSAAGAMMAAERAMLSALEPHLEALPFAVPRPAGSVDLPSGGRAVVYPDLTGDPLEPGDLEPGAGLAAALGRALARLHEVPVEAAEGLGLPTYTAEEYRSRRLVELDQAATSRQVPATILARWEQALEDVGRWRFQPTLVHGDLVSDHVLTRGDEIAAILDWGDAKVADPADDLAWLAVGAEEGAFESVMSAYRAERGVDPDPHIVSRARLAGELAIARWLMHGIHSGQQPVISDAVTMLRELAEDVGEDPL